MRQGFNYRQKKIKGGRRPGRRLSYIGRFRLAMVDTRRQLSLKANASILMASRRSAARKGTLLRQRKRKRSKLLRNS